MADTPIISRRDAEARLIAAAWKDEAFAQELRSDPRGAVQRELQKLGVTEALPADIDIRVVEETPTTLYLVIPPKPQADALSDSELEQVAGGKCASGGISVSSGFVCDWLPNGPHGGGGGHPTLPAHLFPSFPRPF